MEEYTVTWSIPIEATNARDAARQAWAILEDAHRGGPATVLFVDTPEGDHVKVDMELELEMEGPEDDEALFAEIVDRLGEEFDALRAEWGFTTSNRDDALFLTACV